MPFFTSTIRPARLRRGALITGAFGGGTIIGKLGANVFARSPFGNVVRSRVFVPNKKTEKQRSVRQFFQQASGRWPLLSVAQRAAWDSYAAATPFDSASGQPVIASGRNVYVKSAAFARFVGRPIAEMDSAPVTPGIFPSPKITWIYDVGGGVLFLAAVTGAFPFPAAYSVQISRNFQSSHNSQPRAFDLTVAPGPIAAPPFIVASGLVGLPGDVRYVRMRVLDRTTRKICSGTTTRVVGSV